MTDDQRLTLEQLHAFGKAFEELHTRRMEERNMMRLSAYRWRRHFGIARHDPFVFLASDHATRREREHVSLHHRSSADVQATVLLCVALVVAVLVMLL